MSDWRIDIRQQHTGGYFAIDHETGALIGSFTDEGGGWWNVRLAGGALRGLFVPDGGPEEVVRRMLTPTG
ncbi:hypothetical protein [Actinomadura parmotrematis]|uniref:Uncharacterized protein n=1 Tax=Actinomadura parmotrematis TaxID=2864039 RepID=A0ABS7G056_9ACTN|nr:hypothetical protein [Actinomadura parmotrematis]MBW8485202.1 hypothetical protein [Actinomadura parmotrematis]